MNNPTERRHEMTTTGEAIYHDAWVTLINARADLVILTAYMGYHSNDYTAQDIADAVQRPWKYVDVLALATAQLEAQSTP